MAKDVRFAKIICNSDELNNIKTKNIVGAEDSFVMSYSYDTSIYELYYCDNDGKINPFSNNTLEEKVDRLSTAINKAQEDYSGFENIIDGFRNEYYDFQQDVGQDVTILRNITTTVNQELTSIQQTNLSLDDEISYFIYGAYMQSKNPEMNMQAWIYNNFTNRISKMQVMYEGSPINTGGNGGNTTDPSAGNQDPTYTGGNDDPNIDNQDPHQSTYIGGITNGTGDNTDPNADSQIPTETEDDGGLDTPQTPTGH